MRDFTICIGTTFVFGRDAETKVGDELGAKGVSRVLIHHDGGAYLETSGLLDAVRRSLGRAGISYTELGGVKPNPRLTLVREGIAIAKARNVDAVVAIGGGSVIDSAKAIALGAAGERDEPHAHLGGQGVRIPRVYRERDRAGWRGAVAVLRERAARSR